MIEERFQPTGAYISYTTYLFHTLFLINLLLPLGYPLHMPLNFLFFVTPSLRLIFATPVHDSSLRLHFTTPILDPHLRLTVSKLTRHATPPLMGRLCQLPSIISLAFQP